MTPSDVLAISHGLPFSDDAAMDEIGRSVLREITGGLVAGTEWPLPTHSAPLPDLPVDFMVPQPDWRTPPGVDLAVSAMPLPTREQPPVSYGRFYFLKPSAPLPITRPCATTLDVNAVRRDFPILHEQVNGKPLVWLDNGATTHKPRPVIDAICRFYENDNSNVHRAAHALAARATEAYENARRVVQRFIGASAPEEIIFTRGTTESINLAANSLGSLLLRPGDCILVSMLEHHANIVPWQMIASRTGAKIMPIPIDETGQIDLSEYHRLLRGRPKIVALAQVSNVLGTVLPLASMIGPAHDAGAKVLIDGAQSIAHVPVDVTSLDADLFAFSGHKIYGPTGVGVLYGKRSLLEEMPPWQGGGNMIDHVSFEGTTFQKPPAKFEAGTPILAGAVGLSSALQYLCSLGLPNVFAQEEELLRYATQLLGDVPGLKILGSAKEKVGVLSFTMADVTPDAIGQALNAAGVAIRVGHHCAQPVLKRYGLDRIARASLGIYNTHEEIRKLASVLDTLRG